MASTEGIVNPFVLFLGVYLPVAATAICIDRARKRRAETRKDSDDGSREPSGDCDDSDLDTDDATPFAAGGAITGGAIFHSVNWGSPTFTAIRALDPGVTESVAEVPILAYKAARLSWSPGGVWRLSPGTFSGRVETDADARCEARDYQFYMGTKPATHDAPEISCNCGFHAVRSPDELNSTYGEVRLDVELSGRVIVHEKGYRAQHQRVLRAHVPPCWYCGDVATVFWLAEGQPSSGGLMITTTTSGAFGMSPPSHGIDPRPLCAEHAHKAEISVPVEKVMSTLGLPWEAAA